MVNMLIVASASSWMANSLKWAWSGHVNHLNFGGHQPISEMAEARLLNFFTHVGYIKSKHKDDKTPLKGRGQGHVTHLKQVQDSDIVSLEY